MNIKTTYDKGITYIERVLAFTKWTLNTAYDLMSDIGRPLIVPLTVTFEIGSILPQYCLGSFEKFYHMMCRELITNLNRENKKVLRPFTLAFLDDPSTRVKGNRATFFADHPQVSPHIHSIMVLHPSLSEKFVKFEAELLALWQYLSPSNTTLMADMAKAFEFHQLMSNLPENEDRIFSEVRGWIDYSAKLQKQWNQPDYDLFTVLPPA